MQVWICIPYVADELFYQSPFELSGGQKHWNSTKKIRKDAMRRLKRLMKNFKDGTITEEFFDKSFTSRIGSIKHADTYNLVQKITCEAKELKESHA